MKIFRPILQTYNKIFVAFLRKQRNTVPVIVKQIAAINRRKPDYSGYFGTPEGNRTPSLTLRRGALYPIELLAHMQFLFVSVTPAVENPPNVRRRPLYPTELRGLIQKIFNFAGLQDSNDSIFRRAVLCPAELLARMQFLFVSVTPAGERSPNARRRPHHPTELRGLIQGSFCLTGN